MEFFNEWTDLQTGDTRDRGMLVCRVLIWESVIRNFCCKTSYILHIFLHKLHNHKSWFLYFRCKRRFECTIRNCKNVFWLNSYNLTRNNVGFKEWKDNVSHTHRKKKPQQLGLRKPRSVRGGQKSKQQYKWKKKKKIQKRNLVDENPW